MTRRPLLRGIVYPILLAFATSCVAVPKHASPSMPALMGDGKTPAEFSNDDQTCRATALSLVGTTPAQAAQESQVGSAIIGTLLGAGLGAAAGAFGRNAGLGAGVGAAAGLASGTAWGSAAAGGSAALVQSAFDSEYYACMYARGHKVPVSGSLAQTPATPAAMPQPLPPPPPPAVWSPPPPPAGGSPCIPTGKYVKTANGFVEECR
jgi:hypothetical protein